MMRGTKAVNKKRATDQALAKEIEKKMRWEDVKKFVKKKGYRLKRDI